MTQLYLNTSTSHNLRLESERADDGKFRPRSGEHFNEPDYSLARGWTDTHTHTHRHPHTLYLSQTVNHLNHFLRDGNRAALFILKEYLQGVENEVRAG